MSTGSDNLEKSALKRQAPSQYIAGGDVSTMNKSSSPRPGPSKRSRGGLRRSVKFDPQLDQQQDDYQEEKKLKRFQRRHRKHDVEKFEKKRPRLTLKKDINVLGCVAIVIGTVFGAGSIPAIDLFEDKPSFCNNVS